MKKITLLSIATSAYLLAGGAFAPLAEENIKPVVEEIDVAASITVKEEIPKINDSKLKYGSYCAPAEDKVDVSGRVSVLGLTTDAFGEKDFFSKDSSALTSGIELSAEQVFGDVFVGGEVSSTVSSSKLTDNRFALADGYFNTISAAVTELYVGAHITDGTVVQVGRMQLDTPLVFSESWNVIDNTFEALTVDTDIVPNTTIQAGYVKGFNSYENLSKFDKLNGDEGLYFVSAKSNPIKDIELDGAYYLAPETNSEGNVNALYTSARYNGDVSFSGQAGYVFGDNVVENTKAFGIEVESTIQGIGLRGAISSVDGSREFRNVSGTKSPLFTQMEFNDLAVVGDNKTYLLEASNGDYSIAYGITVDDSTAKDDFKELDITYEKEYGEIDVLATYSNIDVESIEDSSHIVRVAARYNF